MVVIITSNWAAILIIIIYTLTMIEFIIWVPKVFGLQQFFINAFSKVPEKGF